MSKFRLLLIIFLISAVTSVITLFLVSYLGLPAPLNQSGPKPVRAQSTGVAPSPPVVERLSADPSTGADTEQLNIRIYEQLSPSVVNITTIEVAYDFFFSPVREQGTGSGSILNTDGHILTNYHVVENADYIQVTLADKSQFKAELIGFDEINDIAVLKIDREAKILRPIPMGSSQNLHVGQMVYAIGNPFGLSHTMTSGIISSLGRSIKSKAGFIIDDVIQSDAAINPGNSGGPLIDSSGRMIGITTSIFTTSGGNIGIGFSVPVDTVRRVVNDLIRYGRVRRPWVGIYGQSITSDLSRYLALPQPEGVLVAYVEPGSSADQAGIRGGTRRVRAGIYRVVIGGDFIVRMDDRPVTNTEDLTSYLLNRTPGDTVTLTLYRDGREIQVRMEMREKSGRYRM
ncbi:MAG: trypsin-like peptidase domain-containing protein [Acidobacteria bacterium]|nr:trypsin-like peptidase domain-containing protein [Acidobacteriota bacterium]